MKILFISPILPVPIIDGDRQRAFHLLKALAQKHTVHFLCFIRDPGDRKYLAELEKFCASARGVDISKGQILANCLLAWFTKLPLNVAAFASARMEHEIAGMVDEFGIEAIHAYRLRMAPYALQRSVGFRVLDYTDAMTRQFETRRDVQTGWLRRIYLNHEIKRLKAYEVAMSREFDHCCISSALDRSALIGYGASEGMVEITNGVDTAKIQPVAQLTTGSNVLFLGNLEYPPNLWGMDAFCEQTWPLIIKELPEAQLLIVGKTPAGLTEHATWKKKGIHFAGVVRDVNEFFARARVAICPLQVASGRQFKVIEYFSAALPTVTSTIVAENLEALAGTHCLVGDTPQDYARQIVQLCQDQTLADRIRWSARELVESRFDWAHAAETLLKLYPDG